MIIATIGPNPEGLPWGYYEKNWISLDTKSKIETWFHTRRNKIKKVISSCSIGWNMICAEESLKLGIPLYCCIPYNGQETTWSWKDTERYNNLLLAAHDYVVVNKKFSDIAENINNEFIISQCDILVTMWDKKDNNLGSVIKFATQNRKEVVNFWHSNNTKSLNKFKYEVSK